MSHWEFFRLLLINSPVYLFSISITGLLTFLVARRVTNSWFDPFRIGFVFVAFANAVPVFLFLINKIAFNDFIYFFFAETSFWIGFLLFSKKNVVFAEKRFVNERKLAYIVFLIFLVLYLIFTGLIYYLRGIPLLMKSRLDLFKDSGGLAILGRVSFFFQIYCLIYGFYLWSITNERINKVIVLFSVCLFILTSILSGSKSNFLYLLYSFWGYNKFYKNRNIDGKKYYKYFIPAFVVGIIVIVIQTHSNVTDGILSFCTRFISDGDIYWMSYPNQAYKKVIINDWFANFFQGFFGPMRLIDYSKAGTILGYQIEWIIYPYLKGFSAGPNSRLPVLGYIYFGWGGLIFSFLNGLFLSIISFKIASFFPKGIFSTIIFSYIYMLIFSMSGDAVSGMSNLFNILFNCVFLFFTIFIVSLFISKSNVS